MNMMSVEARKVVREQCEADPEWHELAIYSGAKERPRRAGEDIEPAGFA